MSTSILALCNVPVEKDDRLCTFVKSANTLNCPEDRARKEFIITGVRTGAVTTVTSSISVRLSYSSLFP